MIAYKFLSSNRVGLFSGVRWPDPGIWLSDDAEVERCMSGIHALHLEGLLGWIDDELWTCELAGIVEDDGQVVVAERGRLVERVTAWNDPSARDFARACAARGREHVVEALRVEGYDDEARELGDLDVEGWVTNAPGLAARLPVEIAGLVLVAADTTALADGRRVKARGPELRSHLEAVAAGDATHGALAANVAFIVAHSTAGLHPDGREAGFAAERAWQLERLVEQLGLAVSAA
ncbi:MAG TPA: hypothetical protein VFG93_11210 [Gaiellaceae bacterium]|nr:hypothetical protein [Gaiellaceae bacterium]